MKPEVRKLQRFLDTGDAPTMFLSRREVKVLLDEFTWMEDRIGRLRKMMGRHAKYLDGMLEMIGGER